MGKKVALETLENNNGNEMYVYVRALHTTHSNRLGSTERG